MSKLEKSLKTVFKRKLVTWGEQYLFHPTPFQKLISFILLPFTFIYRSIVHFKRRKAIPIAFDVPIISIGNLTVGGSGKTPLTAAIAKLYNKPAIVLRGYKRQSAGMHIISLWGKVQCDVATSGDEAMLYAFLAPHALVIVSEKREEGIQKAQELGATVILLDDGFSKAHIQKYDILIRPIPEPLNTFCLPSGPYREPISLYAKADLVVEEGKDFTRTTSISNPTEKMVLVTAIANPSRLDAYLPKLIAKETFPDHHAFTKEELATILKKYGATSLLTTRKDAVKMEDFHLPLSLLELELTLSDTLITKIQKQVLPV